MTRWKLTLEGIIVVTFRLLDADIMSFRHDPLVARGIMHRVMKFQRLSRIQEVKWLPVVYKPIQMMNKYTVYGNIVIISEHPSTYFM